MAENSGFDDFLLKEYSNIAHAHFESINTISNFFKYYLLIISIPISAIPILAGLSTKIQTENGIGPIILSIIDFLKEYNLGSVTVFYIIAFVGLFICIYLINLRLDAILYARTVNGIRKYFFDNAELDINYKNRLRVLPQSPKKPKYLETPYFLWVVVVFGLVNALYFSFGSYIFYFKYIKPNWAITVGVLSYVIFLVIHVTWYAWLSNYRERAYLRANIIGIDIDGVLNKHRDKFCELLKQKTNKTLKPGSIRVIPVHETPGTTITREDEYKVFNDPSYWWEIKLSDGARDNIRKLRNYFDLKVYIFTYRPWPHDRDLTELARLNRIFIRYCIDNKAIKPVAIKPLYIMIYWGLGKWISLKDCFKTKLERNERNNILRFTNWFICRNDYILGGILKTLTPIKHLTKGWVARNNIDFERFYLERGNDYAPDPKTKYQKNRYNISRKKDVRFFVEDDLEKAIKLSYICDIVFLISHPYNKPHCSLPPELYALRTPANLPQNIIRVKNWEEIYKLIRRYL